MTASPTRVDVEEVRLLAELNGQLTEQLEAQIKQRRSLERSLNFFRSVHFVRNGVLMVCGAVALAALTGFGLWIGFRMLTAPGNVTHCRVQAASTNSRQDVSRCPCYELRGVIPWRADTTIGFFSDPAQAAAEAAHVGCVVEGNGSKN